MITDERRFNEVTQKVIRASLVANTLGRGFVEKVYANTLCNEIEHRGILAKREWPVRVFYRGNIVGNFLCDLLVDEQLIIEVKATHNPPYSLVTFALNVIFPLLINQFVISRFRNTCKY